jgi:hypothetical protein
MFDILFALLLASGFSLLLAGSYLVFCLLLYVVYRLDGGKMGLFKYLNKM